ncbi:MULTISPECIES: LysR substrate-binding domain-containing protein [Pseudomonas]|uniref:LysR family transcriptional regulator n=1 Tax=Pseudomonas piscis TaxID=2614538 RepID=U6ZZ49_9PSED|nr:MULTISPECIES: LysR substrate-binding domain-containing protein [Pseudomonas]AZC20122.1 Glycine cleavage system transcriptional activator GcvA [Pseudomonas sp. CMR5c]ERO64372.1 glycine cleavage system regulatory protein [Pseudomonas piscis]MQA55580.1 LysR family transcriptional regulator [Pseudomonas piscis]POA50877.1 transcriptional regulator [Pseudomonas sp. FW507-12TSA]WMN16296.1 LysR substrate-binding domain-containing protein [Pseudomonas piscis]
MSSIPPITCLRSFEAVARLGSVTAAAKELHVTHSAISQQIKVLEEMIGVTLFVREGRGLRVSEDGRLYALQIRESLSGIAEATRLIKTQPKSTELVVAVLPSFGFSWLLPRLPRFQQSQPHISIRLQASLAVSNLTRESVDVGIRMGKGDWDGLEQHLLFHDETLVVAAPHFNGGVLPQTPEEIISSNIIFNMESWQPWCQAAGLDLDVPRIGLCSNDSNLVLQAVRLGQGIALERRSLVDDAIKRGELVQLSPITAPYPYPYWLVLPNRERSEVKQRVFSNWLANEVDEYLNQLAHGKQPTE